MMAPSFDTDGTQGLVPGDEPQNFKPSQQQEPEPRDQDRLLPSLKPPQQRVDLSSMRALLNKGITALLEEVQRLKVAKPPYGRPPMHDPAVILQGDDEDGGEGDCEDEEEGEGEEGLKEGEEEGDDVLLLGEAAAESYKYDYGFNPLIFLGEWLKAHNTGSAATAVVGCDGGGDGGGERAQGEWTSAGGVTVTKLGRSTGASGPGSAGPGGEGDKQRAAAIAGLAKHSLHACKRDNVFSELSQMAAGHTLNRRDSDATDRMSD